MGNSPTLGNLLPGAVSRYTAPREGSGGDCRGGHTMIRYPLFFSHAGPVVGNGFIAHYAIDGRCLLEHTAHDLCTIFGINPGGMAGQGCDPGEAQRDFLATLRSVISDLAAEAASYEAFATSLTAFVAETNEPSLAEWTAAVREVRSGELDRSQYSHTIPAEQPASVRVALVVAPQTKPQVPLAPELNLRDEMQVAA